MMKKAVTIVDVAKAAGVSCSTVSHAISNKRPISVVVRNHIFEKMKELDYRPNFFARAIKNKESRLIGIVLSDTGNPIAGVHVDALSRELAARSYDVVLGLTGDNVEKGRAMFRRFSSGLADGIINLLPQIGPREAEILCGRVPVFTNLLDEFAPVRMDFENMTLSILEYLWNMGHRHIAYIASVNRSMGFEDPSIAVFATFLKNKDIKFNHKMVEIGRDTISCGEEAMEKLNQAGKFSAVFAGNEQMALGVYRWAYRRNLRVPEDISVVGYDDSPLAETTLPPLTCGRFPVDKVARHTVEALMDKMNGKPAWPQTVMTMPLIIRKSVCYCIPNYKKAPAAQEVFLKKQVNAFCSENGEI